MEIEEYKHRGTGSGISAATPSPIQHKNTTVGKTVRTFLQACAGVILVTVPALLTNDDFRNYVAAHPEWGWVLIALPAAVSLATYIQNAADPSVPNTVHDTTV